MDKLSYTKLLVTRGCPYHGLRANQVAHVVSATKLGPEHSHAAEIRLTVSGAPHRFQVRSWSRLNGESFNAHKGDPTRKVTFAPLREKPRG